MNREKRIEILKILQSVMPKVTTELEHKTPFELLIAVVLSAQATDKSVNVATRQIFPEANTPEGILKFGEDRFRDCIKHVGLYKGKTKNVMKLCEILRDEYDSKVPEDIEILQKLPGVGKKTASVVMNVAFNAPFIGVDTHVFRVANRTGYAKGKTPEQVQIKMEKYTPAQYKPKAHQWFLRIGRYICKARIPECWRCPIEQPCEYKEKVLEKPEPKKSKKSQIEQNEIEAAEAPEKEELYLGPTGDEPIQKQRELEDQKTNTINSEQETDSEKTPTDSKLKQEESSTAEAEPQEEEQSTDDSSPAEEEKASEVSEPKEKDKVPKESVPEEEKPEAESEAKEEKKIETVEKPEEKQP